jgi:hypothetical protein
MNRGKKPRFHVNAKTGTDGLVLKDRMVETTERQAQREMGIPRQTRDEHNERMHKVENMTRTLRLAATVLFLPRVWGILWQSTYRPSMMVARI